MLASMTTLRTFWLVIQLALVREGCYPPELVTFPGEREREVLPPDGESVIRSRIRHIPAVACVVAVAFGVASAATADPGPVASKQAEAQSIIAQINTIETSSRLRSSVGTSRTSSSIASVTICSVRVSSSALHGRTSSSAQVALARQAVDVYTSSDSNSTIEVLLGASSLDDLLNRIDTVNRVNDQRSVGRRRRQGASARTSRMKKRELHHAQTRAEAGRRAARGGEAFDPVEARAAQPPARVRSRRDRAPARGRARTAGRAGAAGRGSSRPQQALQRRVATFGGRRRRPLALRADRRGAVLALRRRRRDRDAVSRHAVRLGRRVARRLRLLRPRDVRRTRRSACRCRTRAMRSTARACRCRTSELQPGDLVFFYGLGHVGIYIGGGKFIHAPHTGDVVKISSLSGSYASSFVGARRDPVDARAE